MRGNWKKRFFFTFIPLAILGLMFSFMIGCSDDDCDDCDPVEPDTVTVTITDTVEVAIMQITVDEVVVPDNITQGNTIELMAQVTTTDDVDMDNLTYHWYSDEGMFESNVGDTVMWKAPDDEGSYTVSVHVTDGEYIGIGTQLIGVGMFAPTADHYYVGYQVCETCHSGIVDGWMETGHSEAWAGLMESDHPAPYCFPCHAIGWGWDGEDFVSGAGDGGYDEAPIGMFEDVQCEACHGPASGHPGGDTMVEVSYMAENCGKCHEGAHHPYYTEWEESGHNFDPHVSSHGAGTRGSCEGCHEGVAGLVRLSDDLDEFYGSGTVIADRDTLEYPYTGITCQTCHVSHGAENPGQIRTMADVHLIPANGEEPVITEGGTGKLCMQCHHARRAAETQIPEGYGHFGPHASPQADLLAGKSGYHGVAPDDFPWAGPSHLYIQNSCKTCHLNMIEYDGTTAITGHTFEPTVEACQGCHGNIESFDDIMALEDFDGDGTVEGLRQESLGLLHILEEGLIDAGLDTTGGVSITEALGDTLRSTVFLREAGYNFAFVEEDWSEGIHNPDYAIQLLQQSILYLNNGEAPTNMVILREDNQAVGMW